MSRSPRRPRDLPPGVQPDLFAKGGAPGAATAAASAAAPLAARMRPRELDELLGQDAIVGPGKPLRRMIERDELTSIILWGPPGSGKTTLASIVASHTERHFSEISAVNAGVADIRKAIHEARERQRVSGRRTILFVDELHRFNRAQQDALLPHVEAGTVTFIGATTENPSFYVVAPLLSRSRVFRLELLAPEAIETIVRRALADEERGLGGQGLVVEDETLHALALLAAGDARTALNLLEVAAAVAEPDARGVRTVTRALLEDAAQHRTLLYDREGDAHYDTISAFIKTVRDSDPDGALYWLARMLEAGEDPLFIARRLVILAAEDVGLADPAALPLAVSCQQAVHFLGMPEGRLPLAETTVYLARAPKSNSAYRAYERAAEDARSTPNDPVPLHLRNAVTGLMRQFGYGRGYQYAHDHPGHRPPAEQTHRPPSVEGHVYYEPGTLGDEPRER
ncbi:MAG: replication-associated recombination protein A [Chloroflexi bacterium]|nr:replication-associated recombination protein A [Chloroflexota bacterium]